MDLKPEEQEESEDVDDLAPDDPLNNIVIETGKLDKNGKIPE